MRTLVMLALAACNNLEAGVSLPEKDTGDTDDDSGGGDTDTNDTVDTDDDQDDDGFSPADGDCDDNEPKVSPAREEDDDDGLDNDCDGRVDEDFKGVDVAYVTGEGEGHIYQIDHIGRLEADVQTGACIPIFLDAAPDGGWYVNDNLAAVSHVATDGTCTQLADFSEADWPPYAVTVTPDGTLYVVLADRLSTVASDGTVTDLATWDPETEFYPIGLASDPLTGTVGLFDYYGGFATYHPADGFAYVVKPDFSNPTLYGVISGAHGDDGGWYVPATSAAGVGIFRLEGTEWVLQDEWADEDWSPFMMAVDADDPDRPEFYVSATAGAYQVIWRVIHGSNAAEHLWVSDGSDFGYFYGVVSRFY